MTSEGNTAVVKDIDIPEPASKEIRSVFLDNDPLIHFLELLTYSFNY